MIAWATREALRAQRDDVRATLAKVETAIGEVEREMPELRKEIDRLVAIGRRRCKAFDYAPGESVDSLLCRVGALWFPECMTASVEFARGVLAAVCADDEK